MLKMEQIDLSRFQSAMNGIADALVGTNGDAEELVKGEAKRLSTQITNFTPPIKSKWGNARTSGEMAIKSELYSLFSESEIPLIDTIGSEHGVKDINAWITKKGGEKENLQWANLDPMGDRMAAFHKQYRNRAGKVPKMKAAGAGIWRARVVVPIGSREPYVKNIQRRVGRARASMALCAARLGKNFPSWISRHFGQGLANIAVLDMSSLSNNSRPSITFGSKAPGIYRIADRVQAAVNSRARAMVKRTKLIISGYNKDVAAGIRAQRHAKRTEPAELQPED